MAESIINTSSSDKYSESVTDKSGQFRTPSGLLIQWGTKSISSLTATATTNFTITFPIAYTGTPTVILNHFRTTLANAKRFAVFARSVTTTQINGGYYNSGSAVTSASVVAWLAIGV